MSQRNLSFGAIAAASLLVTLSGAIRASAADLDAGYADIPPPLPQSNVEFGSGWYIRGDIGVTRLPTVTTSTAQLGASPNIAFGQGDHVGYTASLGGGYQINPWFRTDVIADFHEPVRSSLAGGSVPCITGIYYVTNPDGSTTQKTDDGGCTSHFVGKLNSYDVLVNGYIDLGTWHSVTPYVGAGVGLAFGHYSASAIYTQFSGAPYDVSFTDPVTKETFHNNYDHSASGEFYNLAFALMAGISIDVFDHTKLDIGYRYLNLGKLLGSNLSTQEVRAGLRYMIDN